jgi:hypothetical protein
MGRVYDQRRSGTKYIKNGCKFPLGFWKKGETERSQLLIVEQEL